MRPLNLQPLFTPDTCAIEDGKGALVMSMVAHSGYELALPQGALQDYPWDAHKGNYAFALT